MSRTRVRMDPDDPRIFPAGRVDHAMLDTTTEEDIARQARHDDAEAMRDMARFARRVRRHARPRHQPIPAATAPPMKMPKPGWTP